MRASNHSGRTYKNGNSFDVKHNDRQFQSDQDKHIDKTKSTQNIYLICDENGLISELERGESLREHELEIYEKLYTESLVAKNEKSIAQRHPERIKTMEEYLDGRQTCPEEEILQVGKMDEFKFKDANGDLDFEKIEAFEKCVRDYIEEHNKSFPDIKILDASIHVDESSLHCHLRKTYAVPDKEGRLEVSQHRCLEKLGYKLPKPEEKRSRANNLKIPYTLDKREMWLGICEKNLNIELEHEPSPHNQGLTTLEYKTQQQAKKLEMGAVILENQKKQVMDRQEEVKRLESTINDKMGHAFDLDSQIRDKNKSVRVLDHELEEVSSNLDAVKQEYEQTKTSVQSQIQAFETISKGVQNHKIPSVEVAEDRTILREHEHYVKIPAKSQEEAQKLQQEVVALYNKNYINQSLDELINEKYKSLEKKRNKYRSELKQERQQLATEKEQQLKELQIEKSKAIQENQLYRNLKPERMGLDSETLGAYFKDSISQQLVADTVDETIEILSQKGYFSREPDNLDKYNITKSVSRSLGEKLHDFFDRVKEHFIEKLTKTYEHQHSHDFDMDR